MNGEPMSFGLPESITVDQAKQFALGIVDFINSQNNDIDPIHLEDVAMVRSDADMVTVEMCGTVIPDRHLWGGGQHLSYTFQHDTETEELVKLRCKWAEDLGIEPHRIMSMELHGNFLQVTGFVYLNDEKYGEVRVLRSTGDGYFKYTIDIPVIENGDSK